MMVQSAVLENNGLLPIQLNPKRISPAAQKFKQITGNILAGAIGLTSGLAVGVATLNPVAGFLTGVETYVVSGTAIGLLESSKKTRSYVAARLKDPGKVGQEVGGFIENPKGTINDIVGYVKENPVKTIEVAGATLSAAYIANEIRKALKEKKVKIPKEIPIPKTPEIPKEKVIESSGLTSGVPINPQTQNLIKSRRHKHKKKVLEPSHQTISQRVDVNLNFNTLNKRYLNMVHLRN